MLVTAIMPSPAPPPSFLLRGIRFETFERLAGEIENPGVRLTYDRGCLELMSPSGPHEKYKKLLARLIEEFTLELGIPIETGGSTTFKRSDLQKGIEPDECYWVQNEARVRGQLEIDLSRDPPPDLVLESEVSRTVLDRLDVLRDLGVPEVWRYDGERLSVFLLATEEYEESAVSSCFPSLPMDALRSHLARYGESDQTTWIRHFRDWVREELDAT